MREFTNTYTVAELDRMRAVAVERERRAAEDRARRLREEAEREAAQAINLYESIGLTIIGVDRSRAGWTLSLSDGSTLVMTYDSDEDSFCACDLRRDPSGRHAQ
jgi:hypothetical protein